VSSFDFRTHSYVTKDIDTDETQFKMGGSGSYNSSTFKNKYFNPKIPSQAYIPIDTSQRAVTSIKERTPDLQAFITSLMQNSMKVRVYGDANLKAGDMVTANIPNKIATTGNGETDPLLSGDFLVSRIHHEIGTAGQRPRYTCVMELLKGNLEKGVA
jgi:CxxC motif-containing protein